MIKKKKRNAKFVYLDERDGEMQKQEVLDRTVAQMKRELFAKKKIMIWIPLPLFTQIQTLLNRLW